LYIHDALCREFAATGDPIDPPGLRSSALLESAVGRQHTGWGGTLKYAEPLENAATLMFGLCCDHPFHNGNKRTALVGMLAHLDRNNLVLHATKERELLRFVVQVADHAVCFDQVKRGRVVESVPRRGSADEEVAQISAWLRSRTVRIKRGERQITYRELRKILGSRGFEIRDPKNMKVGIYRLEKRRKLLVKEVEEYKQVMSIDWPGDGRVVGRDVIKGIRRNLGLCEEDGVDSDTFYGGGDPVDRFINQHRVILRKLADR
jgi:death-on-curing protein